jgi:hypothetical protein
MTSKPIPEHAFAVQFLLLLRRPTLALACQLDGSASNGGCLYMRVELLALSCSTSSLFPFQRAPHHVTYRVSVPPQLSIRLHITPPSLSRRQRQLCAARCSFLLRSSFVDAIRAATARILTRWLIVISGGTHIKKPPDASLRKPSRRGVRSELLKPPSWTILHRRTLARSKTSSRRSPLRLF